MGGQEGNAFVRHAASAHSQVYAFVGEPAASLADTLSGDASTGECVYVLVEHWGVANANQLATRLQSYGGQLVISALPPSHGETSQNGKRPRLAQSDDPTNAEPIQSWHPELYVVEGTMPSAVQLWRIPCWEVAQKLPSDDAFLKACSGEKGLRVTAFGFG